MIANLSTHSVVDDATVAKKRSVSKQNLLVTFKSAYDTAELEFKLLCKITADVF